MIQTINIEGIKLYGYHGCLEEEAKIGANYIIDVYLTTNFMEAAVTDELSKTIDYCAVYEICKKHVAIRSKLIEQVCLRIYNQIKIDFDTINTVHVRVTKLLPPMNGNVEKVSVEIKD